MDNIVSVADSNIINNRSSASAFTTATILLDLPYRWLRRQLKELESESKSSPLELELELDPERLHSRSWV